MDNDSKKEMAEYVAALRVLLPYAFLAVAFVFLIYGAIGIGVVLFIKWATGF